MICSCQRPKTTLFQRVRPEAIVARRLLTESMLMRKDLNKENLILYLLLTDTLIYPGLIHSLMSKIVLETKDLNCSVTNLH